MRYGVVPAGGLGTRAKVSHAKELSLLGGRPVIEYILDRLTLAGIKRIFVTSAPDKPDLNHYLANVSPHRGQITLRVGERRGLLDGIISPALELQAGDELYFGLPDTIWYPESGFQALRLHTRGLSLGLLPSATPELFGCVTVKGGDAVKIVEKPVRPESSWIWAFGKIPVREIPVLRSLSAADPTFTHVLGAYATTHCLPVLTFPDGVYYDTGTPSGLAAAQTYIANRGGD